MNDFPNFVQQGWQCPICKRIYSPLTPSCFWCGNEQIITTTQLPTTGTEIPQTGTSTCDTTVPQDAGEMGLNWVAEQLGVDRNTDAKENSTNDH